MGNLFQPDKNELGNFLEAESAADLAPLATFFECSLDPANRSSLIVAESPTPEKPPPPPALRPSGCSAITDY